MTINRFHEQVAVRSVLDEAEERDRRSAERLETAIQIRAHAERILPAACQTLGDVDEEVREGWDGVLTAAVFVGVAAVAACSLIGRLALS